MLCVIFALDKSFGSNKRWWIVKHTFITSFTLDSYLVRLLVCCITKDAKAIGYQSEKSFILKTINRKS